MKHWEKKANGWVFLSHASNDYEDVKIIRNYLEENGFSALMFYLKCLEEESKKEKIEELIKWEIEARNIFVLCTSKTAKKSKWFWHEKSMAINNNAFIIPIRIDDVNINDFPAFSNLQIIDMRDSITDESIARLVQIINSKGRK